MSDKLVITKALQRRLEKIKDCNVTKQLLELPDVVGINYLGISSLNEHAISYINEDRLNRYGFGKRWRIKIRYSGKPGSVIQKILPHITNSELESFVNKYIVAGVKTTKSNVSIVHGEKIRYYYHRDQYESMDGDLGCSCMRHAECQDYFDIYVKNPDHVGMAIILNEKGKLKARCLIWYPNTKKDQSTIYFDRIYAVDRETELEMFAWCKQKGFVGISNRNINKHNNIPTISIKLPNLKHRYYPYVDTLYYLSDDSIGNQCEKGSKTLDDADGGPQPQCPGCDEEDVELYPVMDRSTQYCENCIVWSQHYNQYIHNEDSSYCNYTNDFYLEGDVVELCNGNYCYKDYPKLLQDIDEDWFIEGDTDFIQPDGETDWYYKECSLLEQVDGVYYLINSESWKNLTTELV